MKKCNVKGCKQEAEIYHFKGDFCDKHWKKFVEKKEEKINDF